MKAGIEHHTHNSVHIWCSADGLVRNVAPAPGFKVCMSSLKQNKTQNLHSHLAIRKLHSPVNYHFIIINYQNTAPNKMKAAALLWSVQTHRTSNPPISLSAGPVQGRSQATSGERQGTRCTRWLNTSRMALSFNFEDELCLTFKQGAYLPPPCELVLTTPSKPKATAKRVSRCPGGRIFLPLQSSQLLRGCAAETLSYFWFAGSPSSWYSLLSSMLQWRVLNRSVASRSTWCMSQLCWQELCSDAKVRLVTSSKGSTQTRTRRRVQRKVLGYIVPSDV